VGAVRRDEIAAGIARRRRKKKPAGHRCPAGK
jgi:hypothetical protein